MKTKNGLGELPLHVCAIQIPKFTWLQAKEIILQVLLFLNITD